MPLKLCLWENEGNIKTTWSISSNINIATSHQLSFLKNSAPKKVYEFFLGAERKGERRSYGC